MTPRYWDNLIPFFQANGFQCLAPAWPYRNRPVEELRAQPPPELATLGATDILDHYAAVIKTGLTQNS